MKNSDTLAVFCLLLRAGLLALSSPPPISSSFSVLDLHSSRDEFCVIPSLARSLARRNFYSDFTLLRHITPFYYGAETA